MAGDYMAFVVAMSLSYAIRVRIIGPLIHLPISQTFEDFLSMIWMPLLVMGVLGYEGVYLKRLPFWDETQRVFRALLLGFLGILAVVTLGHFSREVSRAVIILTGMFAFMIVPVIRAWWKPYLHRIGLGLEPVLLVGPESWAKRATSGLDRDHYMGIRAAGWVSPYPAISEDLEEMSNEWAHSGNGPIPPLLNLGALESLPAIVESNGIYAVVVAAPILRARDLSRLVGEVQKLVYTVYVVPNVAQVNLMGSDLLYLFYEEIFLLRIRNNLKSRLNRQIKNAVDYLGALILGVLSLPLLLLIAFLIRLNSAGPALYTQPRMGRGGRLFRIYKFRTMYEGAERMLPELLAARPELAEEYRQNHKLRIDPRVTPIGRFLRKTSLDELPQLLNVLKGEMSLIGPRPALEEEIEEHYQELKEEYILLKPGMTGLWQVSGRNDNNFDMRVRLDLWYIRNWSLWLDLVILIRTIGVVFYRRGAH